MGLQCVLIELSIRRLVRFGERKRFLKSFFATFYNVSNNSNLFESSGDNFFFKTNLCLDFIFFKQENYLSCLSRRLNLSPEMRLISNIPEWFKWCFF